MKSPLYMSIRLQRNIYIYGQNSLSSLNGASNKCVFKLIKIEHENL